MNDLTVILGNQLVKPSLIPDMIRYPVFMCESDDLCTHYRYHKLKILFFLTAMREYADELRAEQITCHYYPLHSVDKQRFCDVLFDFCTRHKVKVIHMITIEDHFFKKELTSTCQLYNITLKEYPSPLFLTTIDDFSRYLQQSKKPFMKTFYEKQRKKLDILMTNGKPVGGKFSFDEDNRKKTPKDLRFPKIPTYSPSQYEQDVRTIITQKFDDHPGQLSAMWLPTKRTQVDDYLKNFINDRFHYFGDYEDAIDNRSDVLFHSALSAVLNCGLITPAEIISQIKTVEQSIPINSYEGFIRQITGWREFIRGIYHHFDQEQQTRNIFNHHNKLSRLWYEGSTGIPPLDDAIKQVMKSGYTHHINRLMVIGNIMLLVRTHPQEVYRWFMECFIDSSDWVMGPNVFGMSQFSDGGIFATKPYICGSNYILKMSHYSKGEWCSMLDALYWQFIIDNQEVFKKNVRLRMMVSTVNRFSSSKLAAMKQLASEAINQLTQP